MVDAFKTHSFSNHKNVNFWTLWNCLGFIAAGGCHKQIFDSFASNNFLRKIIKKLRFFMKMKLRDPLTLAPHVIFANPRFRAKSAKKFFQVSEVISLMSLLKNIYQLCKKHVRILHYLINHLVPKCILILIHV